MENSSTEPNAFVPGGDSLTERAERRLLGASRSIADWSNGNWSNGDWSNDDGRFGLIRRRIHTAARRRDPR